MAGIFDADYLREQGRREERASILAYLVVQKTAIQELLDGHQGDEASKRIYKHFLSAINEITKDISTGAHYTT